MDCVKAQTAKSTDIPSIRVIQGKTELSGNSCPSGFAYAGAGKCREVEFFPSYSSMTMPAYAIRLSLGSRSIDAIGLWRSGLVDKPYEYNFHKLGVATNAIYDPKCPDYEPIIYTNSSCAESPTAPSVSEIRYFFRGPAGFANRKELFKFWDKALEDLYGVKNLATEARRSKSTSKSNYSTPMDMD
tara:strand:+ start:57 stop:614 length:558 start_codon:yes stop_codon:yes gene_type:complete